MTEAVTARSKRVPILAAAGSLLVALAVSVLTGFGSLPDRAAAVCAAVCLAWTVAHLAARGRGGRIGRATRTLSDAAGAAAWATGSVATVLLAARVSVEAGRALGEVVKAAPLQATPPEGVGPEGVAWVLLAVAGLLGLAGGRGGWALTVLFSLLLVGAIRVALTFPVHRADAAGGHGRGEFSVVLLVLVAVVLVAFVIACERAAAAKRAAWFTGDLTRPPPEPVCRPGFRPVCAVVGVFLALLVCYHLAIGFDVAGLSQRTVVLVTAGISGGTGVALLVLLKQDRSDYLGEVGLGLVSLAICCAVAAALPSEPAALSLRYPLIFNAALIGLAVVTWLWAWLSCVWHQQLDSGEAWTAAGGLILPARRAAFFAGLFGLAVASLMTIWPRLAAAPGMDDSLGRVAAGVAGHLLLLWAVLWSARRLGRSSFTALAVLTLASMLGFVYVRTVPLTTAAF